MTLIIAGYTSAPVDRRDHAAYYARLGTAPRAGGIGLAWQGPQSTAQIGEILDVLPADWTVTLTAIAATYPAWLADHTFGLASPVESGRRAALAMAREIADTVRAVNDRAGRAAVLAVEFQSAPGYGDRTVNPDPAAFARSLTEIAALDWDGAALLVEHCDAHLPSHPPVKGFLTLDQELGVLAESAGSPSGLSPSGLSPIGLSLNWGRSLIELRDADRVAEHAATAAASGRLRAYTFSGNGDRPSAYGAAWDDLHLPFADTLDGVHHEPTSLLTAEHAARTLAELPSDLLFLAVKTGWRSDCTDPAERADAIIANFATVVDLLDRRDGRPDRLRP